MTTRVAVVGLALLACLGCDQTDQVSGPDPTPPSAPDMKPPLAPGTQPLRLVELPASQRWDMASRPAPRFTSDIALGQTVPAEYQVAPYISSWFVSVTWSGSTLNGYAYMSFTGNWAEQVLDLRIYKNGSLLAQNTWTETGSSVYPRQSGAVTRGSLNAGVSCGGRGNANSKHAAEVRLFTTQSWTTLARANVSDSDVAAQADCPPPPTCELKPQTSVSSSARFRAAPGGIVAGAGIEQCTNPIPPSGGGGGSSDSGGKVCYEVWLVYPGTGVEYYLGDVCYGDYAT